MQLHALVPLFKIFYTFVSKNFSSCRLKFPGKNCRQIYGKSKASVWRNLSTATAPKQNPLLCSFSLHFIFFSEQPFYGNQSTLDSHTNTVISHAVAFSSRWLPKPWQGLLQKVPLVIILLILRTFFLRWDINIVRRKLMLVALGTSKC